MDGIINIDIKLLHLLNGSDSLLLDGFMITLTTPVTWALLYIALLVLVIKNNQHFNQIILIISAALLCVLLSSYIDNVIVKPAVCRLRPFVDPIAGDVDTVPGNIETSYSFFSAHAANTFSLFVFFCLAVRSKILDLTLFIWSMVNCYSRLYLGVHYPTDILVGIICGALVAILLYLLYKFIYKKISPKLNFISSHYTSTGYKHEDNSMVMLAFVITLLYALVKSIIMTIN